MCARGDIDFQNHCGSVTADAADQQPRRTKRKDEQINGGEAMRIKRIDFPDRGPRRETNYSGTHVSAHMYNLGLDAETRHRIMHERIMLELRIDASVC